MNTQVNIKDEVALLEVKKIALKNGLKTTKPELINLAIQISVDSIKYLDEKSFEQATNLKK
jgi:hypothetical protein